MNEQEENKTNEKWKIVGFNVLALCIYTLLLKFVEGGIMIRQRAFLHQRVLGIGGEHGCDLRAKTANANGEGMKGSHKDL